MHSCISPCIRHILSPSQTLCPSNFTDECAWAKWISWVWLWTQSEKKKVLIWKDRDCLLHPPPFPALWHLRWNTWGRGWWLGKQSPARELRGMSCGVQHKKETSWELKFGYQRRGWNFPPPARNDRYRQPNSALLRIPSPMAVHSHQAVFIKFVWFRLWQNSGPKLQNLLGSRFIPKASWSHLEPGIYSSTLGQIKILEGTEGGPGRENKSFPTSFCQGCWAWPFPEKSRTCRGCSQVANLDLHGDKGIWVHPCSMEDLSLRALLRLWA